MGTHRILHVLTHSCPTRRSSETNDGFVIAEKDLELRGGGELLGLKQSGDADYRLASPEQLVRLLPVAHDDARLFVERDGGMEGARGEAVRLCQIGRAHVCTPVTNAHLVCRLLLEKKNK